MQNQGNVTLSQWCWETQTLAQQAQPVPSSFPSRKDSVPVPGVDNHEYWRKITFMRNVTHHTADACSAFQV